MLVQLYLRCAQNKPSGCLNAPLKHSVLTLQLWLSVRFFARSQLREVAFFA